MFKSLEKAVLLTLYSTYGLVTRLVYPYELRLKVGVVSFYVATSAAARKRLGNAQAIILGHDVYVRSIRALTKRLIRHEYKHALQFDAAPTKFEVAYQIEQQRTGYWKNKYERAARNAEAPKSRVSKLLLGIPMRRFPAR